MTVSLVLLAYSAYYDYKEALIEKNRRRNSGDVAAYDGQGHDGDHRMISGVGQVRPDGPYYQQVSSFENTPERIDTQYPDEGGGGVRHSAGWTSSMSNPFSLSSYPGQPHTSNSRPFNTHVDNCY